MIDLPDVQGTEDNRSVREVDLVSLCCINVLAMHPGAKVTHTGSGRGRRMLLRDIGKEIEHFCLRSKIAGARDGDFRRPIQPEADRSSVAQRPDVQPPRLHLNSLRPEVVGVGGNRHDSVPARLKVEEVQIHRRMHYRGWLTIDGY